jgi:ankyrin repeat protein
MSVAVTNAEDSTPLHFSALNGNLEARKTLVERRALLNKANKNGDTLLRLAARNGTEE